MSCPAKQDLALPDKTAIDMFYVYVLSSLKQKRIYIGYSTNLKQRCQEHATGQVRSTKGYIPWKLVYYEAFLNKFDATKREKELKSHAAKNFLLKKIVGSLNEADGKIK
jgi:putative endonuclease